MLQGKQWDAFLLTALGTNGSGQFSSHMLKSTDTNREDRDRQASQREPEREGGSQVPGGVPEVPGEVGKMLFSSLVTFLMLKRKKS